LEASNSLTSEQDSGHRTGYRQRQSSWSCVNALFAFNRAGRPRPGCLPRAGRFRPLGRAWRETDDGETDRATLIRDLLGGQYDSPIRIVAFNTAEGWSRDVTEDIANDLQDVWSDRLGMPTPVEEFIQEHATQRMARQLSFAI